jgi:predicted DNA-binding transcriptional regulator YafY
VPIWATSGPGGGYSVDPAMTLPTVNFTAAEALALSLAVARAGPIPFGDAARTALTKLVAAMSGASADEARRLAERVRLLAVDEPDAVPPAIEQAILERQVLAIGYEDGEGTVTERVVEPAGIVGNAEHWYLVGWCRLREGGRSFRLDRIRSAAPTGERAPARDFELVAADLPQRMLPLPLAE